MNGKLSLDIVVILISSSSNFLLGSATEQINRKQASCISMIVPKFHKLTGLEHRFYRIHHHSLLKLHSIYPLQVKN